jgi:hypothetical protein
MGPNALRYSERVLAILRAGGVPDQLAVLGQHLLLAAVNGFTLDETVDAGGEGQDTDRREVQTEGGTGQALGDAEGGTGQALGDAEGGTGQALGDAATMARDYLAALPRDRFPNLVDLAGHFAFTDADARFELLLDLFVDGLAQRAAASRHVP